MSLIDAAERFAAMDRSAVTFDASRCLHAHERNAECESCFAICPCDAITPGKPPALDPAKCENCLACLPACPSGAYHADDAVAALLRLAPNLEDAAIELACARHPAPASSASESGTVVLVRGCLAGLGSGAYLALAALSMERITVRTDACASCEWSKLLPEIEQQVVRARVLLAAWDKRDMVLLAASAGAHTLPVWKSENPPLSRRNLFRMMAHQGQVALARAMENGQRATGRQPGRDRLRVVGAARHMPSPSHEPAVTLRELGFASVAVSEACTACGACAKACPVEALLFEKDDDNKGFSLKFLPHRCIACGLCARVCMPDAVSLADPASFEAAFADEPVTLQEGELARCKQCGAAMAKRDRQEFCDVCKYRRTHPFGSRMPPGLLRSTTRPGDIKQ